MSPEPPSGYTDADVQLVVEVLPVDPDSNLTVVGWRDHVDEPYTSSVWGAPNDLARRILRELAAAGRLLPPDTRTETEWGARIVRTDGDATQPCGDDDWHARLLVESVTTYLSTLNEPTRESNGVIRAELVARTVRTFADGSTLVGPWVPADPEDQR